MEAQLLLMDVSDRWVLVSVTVIAALIPITTYRFYDGSYSEFILSTQMMKNDIIAATLMLIILVMFLVYTLALGHAKKNVGLQPVNDMKSRIICICFFVMVVTAVRALTVAVYLVIKDISDMF